MTTNTNPVDCHQAECPSFDAAHKPKRSKEAKGGMGSVKTTVRSAKGSSVHQAQATVTASSESNLSILTEDQQDKFSYIFNALAIKTMFWGIPSLLAKQSAMMGYKTELEGSGIHPLSSLMYFVVSLKDQFKQVYVVFKTWKTIERITEALGENAWDIFIQETVEKLQEQHANDNVLKYLPEFSEKTGLALKELESFIENEKWEDMIFFCFGIEKAT